MKKSIFILVLSFLLIFFAKTEAYSQSKFIHRVGKTIVDSTGNPANLRGVNLGGWLIWEGWLYGGGFIGETDILNNMSKIVGVPAAQQFRKDIYQNFVTEKDIKAMSESCFNVVRVAFNHVLLEDDSAPFVYKQSGWNILDSTLKWCEKYDVYAVIDLHAAPGGQSDLFMADPDKDTMLWGSDFKKARTIALWKAIATRYKDRKIVAGYDLLNEPKTPWFGEWQLVDIYNKIIQAIRTVDNNHMVILEGTNFAKDFWMFSSLPDPNMTFSFHLYTSYSNDNPQTITQGFKTVVDNMNVPMWCGEWGENRPGVIDTTRKVFEDPANEVSGWCFWTWKEVNTNNSFGFINTLQNTPSWNKLIKWVTDSAWWNPKPTYAEAIQGIAEFIQTVKYDNTVHNASLNAILNTCLATTVKNIQMDNKPELGIYPNPASTVVNFGINESHNSSIITVFDISGKEVQKINLLEQKDFSLGIILPNGIYIAQLVVDGKYVESKRFQILN